MIVLLSSLVCAQNTEQKVVSKIIQAHYVNVNHLRDLLNNIPGVTIKADSGMGVLVVSGRPDSVDAIEEMVKKLDIAPRDVEVTAYLLSGSSQSAGDNLPAELGPAVKQLHALFAYKGYKLIDSFVSRGREGRGVRVSGTLPNTNSRYAFGYGSADVSGESQKTIRIDGLDLSVATPLTGPDSGTDKNGNPRMSQAGIHTDLDAVEGQKVVVGKSNVNGTNDAMILIITVKVIN